jgi:hypothetical protein
VGRREDLPRAHRELRQQRENEHERTIVRSFFRYGRCRIGKRGARRCSRDPGSPRVAVARQASRLNVANQGALSSSKAQTKSRGCQVSSRDSIRYTLQTHGVEISQVPRDKCEIAHPKFGTDPALPSGSGCRGFPASAAGPFTMRTADRPNTLSADTTIRLIVVSIKNGTPRLKGRSISRLPDVEDGKGPQA